MIGRHRGTLQSDPTASSSIYSAFDTKEPGKDDLKFIPHLMMQYTTFLYRVAHSPFQDIWLWLKPKGLDKLVDLAAPKDIKTYTGFTSSWLERRMDEEKSIQGTDLDLKTVRKDLFHYLFQAKDPATGAPGYSHTELLEENNLLVIAGADTTSTTIAAMFFYLVKSSEAYRRLTDEVRSTFKSAEEIRTGSQLGSCRYLRAFIDEALRMNAPVSAEMPRQAEAGGIEIDGQFLPQGTEVAVSLYSLHHNEDFHHDAFRFRPERWLPNDKDSSSATDLAATESAFAPFSSGSRGCPGKNLAYIELSIVMAKTLFRADVRLAEGDHLGEGRTDLGWGRRNKSQFQTKDAFVSAREGPTVQFKAKACVAATEVVHTPKRPKGKPIKDYQMPWTERVARSRAKAPVRRLSAGEERRTLRYASDVQEEKYGDEWERTRYPTRHGHDSMLFGFPTTITQQSDALEDGSIDGDWDQDYVPFSATAPSFLEGDRDTDRLGWQALKLSQATTEYRKYSIGQDEIFSPFTNHTHELGTTGDSDLEQPVLSMKDQLTNAFALHALNQCMGGGFRNEFANVGQTAKPLLKLTQKPRTKVHGHNAFLWLYNYDYSSFLDCAKALILHEEQTVGFPRPAGHLASQRPRFGATIKITRDQNKVNTVSIDEHYASSKKKYEKSVLPVLKLTGPDKPRIRVHTKDLKCGFDCDCYLPGDLTFTAPDHGSLRVNIDWHGWKSDNRVTLNGIEFEQAFLDLMFPLATFAYLAPFEIELPDGGPVLPVTRSLDNSLYPTLGMPVQRALSDLAGRVREENVREKEVKVWIRREESPSQKSPDRIRAEGTFFVYRPARTTHFTYDAPHTMRRFLAQARAQLYPDTPVNELRLMISPSNAAREAGKLLTPIAEREEGFEEPNDNGRTAEDYWKDEYLGSWLDAEEDIWAIKVFDLIKVFDGTRASKEAKYWDTRTLASERRPLHSTVSLHGSSCKLIDGLAEISRDLLGINPRTSELGIVLHVKRPDPATQTIEWLKWSSEHSLNQFLLEVFYKLDSSEIVIYPGDHTEAVFPQPTEEPLTIEQVSKNMARIKGKAMDPKKIQHVTSWTEEDQRSPSPIEERPQIHPSQAFNASEIRRLTEQNTRLQAQIEHREEACRVCGLSFSTEGEGPVALQEHYTTHRALRPRECPYEGCKEDLEDRARYPNFNSLQEHATKCDTRVEDFESSTVHLRAKAYKTVPSSHPEAAESSRVAATRGTAATSSATGRPTRQRNAPTRGGRKAAAAKQPNEDRALANALVGTAPTESAVQGNGDAPLAGTTTSTALVMPDSLTMPPPASPTKKTSRKRPAAVFDSEQTPSEEPPAKSARTTRATTAEAAQLLDTSASAAPQTQGPAQQPTVKTTTSRKRKAEDSEPAADNTTAEQPKSRGRPTKKAKTALRYATSQADPAAPSDPANEPTGQPPKRTLRLRGPRPKAEAGSPPPPGNDSPAPPPPAKPARKARGKTSAAANAPSTATEQPHSSHPPPTQQVPSVEPAAMPAPEGQLTGDAAAAAPAALKKRGRGRPAKAKKAEEEPAADAGASSETGGGEAVEEQEGQGEETGKGRRKKKPTAKMAESKKQRKSDLLNPRPRNEGGMAKPPLHKTVEKTKASEEDGIRDNHMTSQSFSILLNLFHEN
ncbi:MAG: hypothetical protein Q9203_003497 [Teloschistes exilis]